MFGRQHCTTFSIMRRRITPYRRMKTVKLRSTVLLVSLATVLQLGSSQSIEPLSADRPDQTESASVVPIRYIQAEIGFVQETQNATSSGISAPGLLLRYGVVERVELRLIGEVLWSTNAGTCTTGMTPAAIGFKVRLTEESGSMPKTSFLGHLTIPGASSPVFRTTYAAPSFRFAMDHSVSDHLSLSYNIGAEWDGTTAEPIFTYTLVSGFAATPAVGIFMELYGFAPQGSAADHLLDAGATYMLSDDLMIDLSAGIGLTSNAPDHFISAGLSYRTGL